MISEPPARGRGDAEIPLPPTEMPRDIADMITQLGGDFVDVSGETGLMIRATDDLSEVFRNLRRTEGNLVGEFTRRRFAEDVTIQQQKELERAARLRFVAEQGLRFGTISVNDAVSLLTQAQEIAREQTSGLGGAVETLAGTFADTVSTIIDEIERLVAAKEDAAAREAVLENTGAGAQPAFEDFDFAARSQPLPLLQTGGFITRTGAAVVHEGETVIPAGGRRGDGFTFNVTNQVSVNVDGGGDPNKIAAAVRRELERGGDTFKRQVLVPAIRRERRLGRL